MPLFCSPTPSPFRGCWKSTTATAHDLISVGEDGKCQFVIDINNYLFAFGRFPLRCWILSHLLLCSLLCLFLVQNVARTPDSTMMLWALQNPGAKIVSQHIVLCLGWAPGPNTYTHATFFSLIMSQTVACGTDKVGASPVFLLSEESRRNQIAIC